MYNIYSSSNGQLLILFELSFHFKKSALLQKEQVSVSACYPFCLLALPFCVQQTFMGLLSGLQKWLELTFTLF